VPGRALPVVWHASTSRRLQSPYRMLAGDNVGSGCAALRLSSRTRSTSSPRSSRSIVTNLIARIKERLKTQGSEPATMSAGPLVADLTKSLPRATTMTDGADHPSDSTGVHLVSRLGPAHPVLDGYPESGSEGESLTTPWHSVVFGSCQ
jgi:hypothetical protein